ncbi:MAG: ABC transporter substrate-binding protein [Chloroflexota bacterium]
MKQNSHTQLFITILTLVVFSVACTGVTNEIVTVEEAEAPSETENFQLQDMINEAIVDETIISEEVATVPGYAPEGTLQIAHPSNHVTWDPHKDQRTASLQYLNPVFEGLLRESNDGRSFIAELATGWVEDEAGVTFTLREGVTFHDGTPFDAEVVVANFNRVKEVGHNVYKGLLRNVASVEAIDALTVRYHYSRFDGTVLLTLSRFAGKMISPAAFATVHEGNPIGTGPYIYNAETSALDNTFKVYDFNPTYWNNLTQPVARVELTHLTDGATTLNGLYTETFHTIAVSTITQLNQVIADGYSISRQPAFGWSVHILDRHGVIIPELADERVRMAMNYAIDRDALSQIFNGGQRTTQFALPGGYAFADDIEDLHFDMEKAMALMAEAGNPALSIDVPTTGILNARNAFLASSWEPLGITLNIIPVNNIFAGCTQAEGRFPVALCPINERHIKHFVENRLLEKGFLNPFNHVDEKINALYAEAAYLSLDEAEPFYAEIVKISAEQGYVLYMGWSASPIAYDPERISGVEARFIYPATYHIGYIDLLE